MERERGVGNLDREKIEGAVTSRTSESLLDAAKANGIDYLQDVNAAAKDLINLLRETIEDMDRSLRSGGRNSTSSARDRKSSKDSEELDPNKNDQRKLLLEEPSNVCSTQFNIEGDESIPKDVSQSADTFLTAIRFLVDYTENRMNVSPMQEQEHERQLLHAFRNNAQTETEIRSLNDALSAQRTEHKKRVDKLYERLNTCEKMNDEMTTEVRNQINRIVNESESNMVKIHKEFVAKKDSLDSEIRIVDSRLNDARRIDIIVENELRRKRCRVERELIDFLAKYDAEIGGRNMEMENLADEFHLLDTEKRTLEKDVMIDLRMLHDELQNEKAAALLKLLNERVDKFVRNRAARVIQRAWRAYWERHCAKKKKKSRRK